MSGCPFHIDLTAPETFKGGVPREVFKYLRDEEPVYWHEDPEQGVGFWAITRHEDLDFISKNPFSELGSRGHRPARRREL